MASPDKKAFLLRLATRCGRDRATRRAELRSVNGQIEYLLREALARRIGSSVESDEPAEAGSARKGQKGKR